MARCICDMYPIVIVLIVFIVFIKIHFHVLDYATGDGTGLETGPPMPRQAGPLISAYV